MRLNEVEPGSVVRFEGVVIGPSSNGTTAVVLDGVGGTGQWAVANSAEVEVMEQLPDPIDAARRLLGQRRLDRLSVDT